MHMCARAQLTNQPFRCRPPGCCPRQFLSLKRHRVDQLLYIATTQTHIKHDCCSTELHDLRAGFSDNGPSRTCGPSCSSAQLAAKHCAQYDIQYGSCKQSSRSKCGPSRCCTVRPKLHRSAVRYGAQRALCVGRIFMQQPLDHIQHHARKLQHAHSAFPFLQLQASARLLVFLVILTSPGYRQVAMSRSFESFPHKRHCCRSSCTPCRFCKRLRPWMPRLLKGQILDLCVDCLWQSRMQLM